MIPTLYKFLVSTFFICSLDYWSKRCFGLLPSIGENKERRKLRKLISMEPTIFLSFQIGNKWERKRELRMEFISFPSILTLQIKYDEGKLFSFPFPLFSSFLFLLPPFCQKSAIVLFPFFHSSYGIPDFLALSLISTHSWFEGNEIVMVYGIPTFVHHFSSKLKL